MGCMSPASSIDVLLCDDSEAFRRLTALQLADDGRFRLVGEAAGAEQCLTESARAEPDIVLLDHGVVAPGDWERFVATLRQAAPGARVLLFSGLPPDRLQERARLAGLDGFAHKDRPHREVFDLMSELAGQPA
jgi:DNA-binding NarL/FixJ family response regulator